MSNHTQQQQPVPSLSIVQDDHVVDQIVSLVLSKTQSDSVRTGFSKHARIGQDLADFNLNILDMDVLELYGLVLAMAWKLDLPAILCISIGQLLDWIVAVNAKYLNNPYHSFSHAVDVTFICFYSLYTLHANTLLTDFEQVTLFFAALCHDMGHPGKNNTYMINVNHNLASQYRNQSVLESYSVHLGHELLLEYRILHHLSKRTREMFFNLFKDLILATDMAKHFSLVKELGELSRHLLVQHAMTRFNQSMDCESVMLSQPDSKPLNKYSPSYQVPPASPSSYLDVVEPLSVHHQSNRHQHSFLSSVSSYALDHRNLDFKDQVKSQPLNLSVPPNHLLADLTTRQPNLIIPETKSGIDLSGPAFKDPFSIHDDDLGHQLRTAEQRQQLVKSLLHAADISNTVRPWDLCKRWSDLVETEHFAQGDAELSLGIPFSSPNMDRRHCQQAKVSIDFLDVIIYPFFVLLADVIPSTEIYLNQLSTNRALWEHIHTRDKIQYSQHDPAVPLDEPKGLLVERGRRVSVAAGTIVIPEHFFRAAAASSPLGVSSPVYEPIGDGNKSMMVVDSTLAQKQISSNTTPATTPHWSITSPFSSTPNPGNLSTSALDQTPTSATSPIPERTNPFVHQHRKNHPCARASVSLPTTPIPSLRNIDEYGGSGATPAITSNSTTDFDTLYLAYLARAQYHRRSHRPTAVDVPARINTTPIVSHSALKEKRPVSPFSLGANRPPSTYRRYSLEVSEQQRRRRRSSSLVAVNAAGSVRPGSSSTTVDQFHSLVAENRAGLDDEEDPSG